MRNYYAIKNPYGVETINNGAQANQVYKFEAKQERDRFAQSDPAQCEAVKASHPAVRRANRMAVKMRMQSWPFPV